MVTNIVTREFYILEEEDIPCILAY
jgi:hypothetical protein